MAKILITNHWLKKLAGSETFTYTLGGALKRAGHDVDLFTFVKGRVSNRLLSDYKIQSIDAASSKNYDLILANHTTCVKAVHQKGFTIQTCHGTLPKLEQPVNEANIHVSISEEVQEHLKLSGINSIVIRNGIDCNRFRPYLPLNEKVKKVLSFGNSEDFNNKIAKYLERKGIQLFAYNKFKNPFWDTEHLINGVDMVISLGRGAYESLACGRPVLVLDHRLYQPEMGDGFLMPENIDHILKTNCSGRANRRTDTFKMIDEAISQYDKKLGTWCRQFAEQELNIDRQVVKYIDYANNFKS